jgi:hypothetical protein
MTFDEQLRAALNLEAEMLDAPRPDVQDLISGGRERRRRRNTVRLGGVAAVAVLVAGGVYGVIQIDPGSPSSSEVAASPTATPEPTTTSRPVPIDGAPLDPDTTYRMLVGVGATGDTIDVDLTVDGARWTSGNFPVVSEYLSYGGVGAYRPIALAAGSGCTDDAPSMDVGETTRALAQQLTQLPNSTVVQPATPVQAFGHDALHLQLRIAEDCPDDQGYRVAETPRGSFGINYSADPKDVVIDFWVVDLDGVPVVVDMWHQDDASSQLVDRIARTRDSITFVTGR